MNKKCRLRYTRYAYFEARLLWRIVLFIFCNPTDNFDAGVDSWVFIFGEFGEAPCSLSLGILATFSGNAIGWKKAYLKHDGGNIYFACRLWPCNTKQTYDNVVHVNCVVAITNCLWVSLALPYIAIRIIEDIGSHDSENLNIYLYSTAALNIL
jgi:hypothetical protein